MLSLKTLFYNNYFFRINSAAFGLLHRATCFFLEEMCKEEPCRWQKKLPSAKLFSLVHVPSTNMEEVVFVTYTAASHQSVIEMPWLHFKGTLMSSSFIYNNLQSSGGSCQISKVRATFTFVINQLICSVRRLQKIWTCSINARSCTTLLFLLAM